MNLKFVATGDHWRRKWGVMQPARLPPPVNEFGNGMSLVPVCPLVRERVAAASALTSGAPEVFGSYGELRRTRRRERSERG